MSARAPATPANTWRTHELAGVSGLPIDKLTSLIHSNHLSSHVVSPMHQSIAECDTLKVETFEPEVGRICASDLNSDQDCASSCDAKIVLQNGKLHWSHCPAKWKTFVEDVFCWPADCRIAMHELCGAAQGRTIDGVGGVRYGMCDACVAHFTLRERIKGWKCWLYQYREKGWCKKVPDTSTYVYNRDVGGLVHKPKWKQVGIVGMQTPAPTLAYGGSLACRHLVDQISTICSNLKGHGEDCSKQCQAAIQGKEGNFQDILACPTRVNC